MAGRRITPEEIARAREMDLLTYLRYYEPGELVKDGSEYTTRTHDSLRISNGKWIWWSRGFGGVSALDYLIKVKGIPFIEAVSIINGQDISYECPAHTYEKKNKRLLLPERNQNNHIAVNYLKQRGIDEELIQHCIAEGMIYESKKYNSVVFLGFDERKAARYGGYRSTDGSKLLGDVSGSSKKYSFRIINRESDKLYVFESAIDLLSYITLYDLKNGQWKKKSYMSLSGVYCPAMQLENSKMPAAIEEVLRNDNVKEIYLCLDNDYAGNRAAKALFLLLSEKEYSVEVKPPEQGKDYNDYLRIIKGVR